MSNPDRSSSMHRRHLCLGSGAAEAGMPDTSTALSERGDHVHEMMRSNDFTSATPSEMDTIGSLVRMSAQVEEDVIGNHKRTKVVKERLFTVCDKGAPVITGHPDRVLIWKQDGEERSLILDFKTGFLEVDSAEENLQLLCYALGVWQELGIKRIFAKIIMPMSKGHQVVEYDEEALKDGLDFVLGIVAETKKPSANRTPSEPACRYCKALGTSRCPETSQIVEQAADEVVIPLTGEQMARRIELFGIAEKIIEKDKAAYKELLAKDAEAIPGYYLKPGNVLGKIFNAQATFEIVAPVFTAHFKETSPKDADDKALALFQSCVTVNKGKLEDAISDATRLKGMALDNECERLLSTVIVKSQNAPSLSKMPKAMLKERGLA